VLAADGQAGLRTVALRPSGIFGEGDPVFVPTVVKQVWYRVRVRGRLAQVLGGHECSGRSHAAARRFPPVRGR
jgi:nucleoside-diphosphate-sugar epimerase